MQHPMVMMTKLTVLDSIVSFTCSSVNVLATYNSALGVNEAMVIVVTHHQLVYSKPYRWCNGKRDCIESWVDREFDIIVICYFFATRAALRSKNKDLLALNQDNVSECNNMSTRERLFQ